MLKKLTIAISLFVALSASAQELKYINTYDLPYWNGNPYTPMAISRIELNKSSPNPLNASYILGVQDRELFNNMSLSKSLENHQKPIHLFNNWFIQAERVKSACNGTQIILRSSTGDLRSITIKPERVNWLDKVFDCYVGKKHDKITRVIYLTNDVVAFDSTIGLFFFNMKSGKFYNEIIKNQEGVRTVIYQTQDNDFLLETVQPGTPIRKMKDGFDPRIGLRALRLNGEKIPGKVEQQDLNQIIQKRAL